MYTGEIAALTTAFCWAIAARMFQLLGAYYSPLALNFWKGALAAFVLVLVTLINPLEVALSHLAVMWLVLSGIIGIGMGDTFFFQALNRIGDSQSILVAETLAPIFTALFAMAWINEWLTWQQWLGVALVLVSVDVIIKLQKRSDVKLFSVSGYIFAALAAVCQAVGAVISRDILTSTGIDAANASLYRLLGGLVSLVVVMLVLKRSFKPKRQLGKNGLVLLAGATLLGTFAALFLQMIAFAHTKAAIVQTLFATSVVLSLIVAKVLGEKVNRKTFGWSLLALVGVSVLILS
ncbi:DMT family transporter [Alteromonas oceanisediminis]|uniref:DMT family transporter n=1 Tax=Alteromonas oceanisediminis TaxID=2836180 RepID=UPI001BDB2251|nr:DMT family transporter [Alteromonas oceanisediminis]MBT0586914.1 DMT family transporter [Alteromonas oceanisediminis]